MWHYFCHNAIKLDPTTYFVLSISSCPSFSSSFPIQECLDALSLVSPTFPLASCHQSRSFSPQPASVRLAIRCHVGPSLSSYLIPVRRTTPSHMTSIPHQQTHGSTCLNFACLEAIKLILELDLFFRLSSFLSYSNFFCLVVKK